jgi:hypothetical protein
MLEPEHKGEFVAIEPETERYFLGSTDLAALRAGRSELPDKLFYLLRVGQDEAYSLGGCGKGATCRKLAPSQLHQLHRNH